MQERSPIVRLSMASALQRIPVVDRWEIASALAAHAEDADDANIPLMLWYAIEPMVASGPGKALKLGASAKIPLVRQFIARRYASLVPPADDRKADFGGLVRVIAGADDPAVQADFLGGAIQGLTGRKVAIPGDWAPAYASLARSPYASVRRHANRLALILGDPAALAATRKVAADPGAPAADRLAAIDGLVSVRDADLPPLLHRLLDDRAVRSAALRALASADHPETAALILKAYPALEPAEKADAVATLIARTATALAAPGDRHRVADRSVAKADVSPSAIQALTGFTDPKVKATVAKVWGATRPSSAEKKATIARLKAELTPDSLARADRSRGRAVFAKTCATCHTLFDAGGKIGPELTGAQRTDLDYVLTNVVDPSAVVGSDFRVNVFATADGRVLSGIVKGEDANSVLIQTANDAVTIPKADLEARRTTPESLMPEGLLNGLTRDEVRDLVAYLA